MYLPRLLVSAEVCSGLCFHFFFFFFSLFVPWEVIVSEVRTPKMKFGVFSFVCLSFLGLHPRHMEVPRLRV